jgi:hypothetical protein
MALMELMAGMFKVFQLVVTEEELILVAAQAEDQEQ